MLLAQILNPWCIPALYLAANLLASLLRTETAWRVVEGLAVAALAVALSIVGVTAVNGGGDVPGLGLLLLISFLGWIIIRFSRRYLQGEPRQEKYIFALTLTLAGVGAVAASRNLGVMAAAWVASSLSLHQLLTFYRDRPTALIVAHKKFLAARLADVCLAWALVLIHREVGSLDLHALEIHLTGLATMPTGVQAAMLLVALAVILKSAQLPVHGWLIQVMEAPTPVSALLHAGVVNLGGFMLIRLALPLSGSPVAQALLVIVGSASAVTAGLVMMTRISIKVRLAWSTCAQMGFMLMECGLGLYEIAFLHLLAHSLYKAHSFLTAGEAVTDTLRRRMMPSSKAGSAGPVLAWRLVSAALAVGMAFGLDFLAVNRLGAPPLPWLALFIVGLGVAPLWWGEPGKPGLAVRGAAFSAGLVLLYAVWHRIFGGVVAEAGVSQWLVIWSAAAFGLLYLMQTWLLAYPQGRVSKTLYPWAYYGFYLDERFTRLAFRLWPVRLPGMPKTSPLNSLSGETA